MKLKFFLVIFVLILGIFLRFYQLNSIPSGIDSDEASQGYDAYSILNTGMDRYGQFFPIFMRSFGNYQSSLYTYLTIIPTYFFDLSPFSTRFISAISGVLILICTFFITFNLSRKNKFVLALISTLFVAISPWAILFSRTAVEANLALAILLLSILCFILSLKNKPALFVLACTLLGLSTYAYHAERIVAVIFICAFGWFARNVFFSKKILVFAISLFFIVQIPQLLLINTPASKSRLSQVNYWNTDSKSESKTFFVNNEIINKFSIVRKFFAQYTSYFSPKNLFFEADEQVIRSMPDLSIFYSWMIVPFFLGIALFLKEKSNMDVKILLLMLIVSPIPAAVTREPFYTLRVLPLFWVMTIMISYGSIVFLEKIKKFYLKILVLISLILFSLILLFKSYFVLLKYERMGDFGYYNNLLINKLDEFKESKIVVDSSRMNLGIWYFYQKKYNPKDLQTILSRYVEKGYYYSAQFDEEYKIDNLEIKPINFGTDICKNTIIVGDSLSVSEEQAKNHNLQLIFEIKDLNNLVKFKGYSVKSNEKC